MYDMLETLFSNVSGESGLALGFALALVIWVAGLAFSSIFCAFDVGTGLDDIDTSS